MVVVVVWWWCGGVTPQLEMKVLNSSVGDVSASDVALAVDAKALIIAFNVKVPPAQAKIMKGASAGGSARCCAAVIAVLSPYLVMCA